MNEFAFGQQKRAKQTAIYTSMPECPSAKRLFDSPYLVREVLKYLEADDLKAVRLIHKGGINRFWTDAKFVHETLGMLQGPMGKTYQIDSAKQVNYEHGYTNRIEYMPEFESSETGRLIVGVNRGGSRHAGYEYWRSSMNTASKTYQEMYRPDNRVEVYEREHHWPQQPSEEGEYILERPFIAYNVSIRPDVWAHYPWKMKDVNEDGKLVINGKVLL